MFCWDLAAEAFDVLWEVLGDAGTAEGIASVSAAEAISEIVSFMAVRVFSLSVHRSCS